MPPAVTVDIAGAQRGGAARLATELRRYLARTGRWDVSVIGAGRSVEARWLLRREVSQSTRGRRVAMNNVSFVTPGGERWTLLRNALHFLTESEISQLDPSLAAVAGRDATVVRWAAQRSDVLVAPSTAMADRVSKALPRLSARLVVRPHPVSPSQPPARSAEPVILCPVLFSPYKQMASRISEWITAVGRLDPTVKLVVTADPAEIPAALVGHPRVEVTGRVPDRAMGRLWARCAAVYFPTTIESFGFPLAEARVNGYPAIAVDTPQNREIAGPALRGFTPGDPASLCHATELALTTACAPDPGPFDPDAYFTWLLRAAQ